MGGRLFLTRAGIVAATVLIGIMVLVGGVSGVTITVCSSGCNYTSIQVAVNAANARDTINVSAGTYSENLDVNKSVNLVGAGADVTIVSAFDSNDHVIDVSNVNSVNISGFTVTGATGSDKRGIFFNGASNGIVSNNNLSNNYRCFGMSSSSGNTLINNVANSCKFGFMIFSSNNNTLKNNTANSNYYYGIYLLSSNNNTLVNNTANSNGYHGIYLSSSIYNLIQNSTANSNSWKGIYLDSSNLNTLDKLILNSNTWYGLNLISSNNNTLNDIEANENSYEGILLEGSSFNQINDTYTYYNSWGGVRLDKKSDENILTNNELRTNFDGLTIMNSSNNNVSKNLFYGNVWAGVQIENNGSKNVFFLNNMTAGWKYGVLIFEGSENVFYHNNFMSNSVANVQDDGNNTWDNGYPEGGNYWDDFDTREEGCVDSTLDGICDSGYNGSFGDIDDGYHLTFPNGWKNIKPPLIVNKTSPSCLLGNSYYLSIQSAINDANAGDTVYVCRGTYAENVDVNKSVNLIGEGADVTIVNASNSGDHVFEVTANSVNISGFTVTGATEYLYAGIYITEGNYADLSNNNASKNYVGIYLHSSNSSNLINNTANSNVFKGIALEYSNNNTIYRNNASLNDLGIWLYYSSGNTITNNTVNSNRLGVGGTGIHLAYSSGNTITNNTNSNNSLHGIYLFSSDNNTLTKNTPSMKNLYGILLQSANSNTIDCLAHSITGAPGATGIKIYGWNNTVRNCVLKSFDKGIVIYNSDNGTIVNNTMTNSWGITGIHIESSDYNTIANNSVSSKSYGIVQYTSNYNIISNNTVTDITDKGIYITGTQLGGGGGGGCSHSNISGNNVSDNGYGIYLDNEDDNLVTENYVYANTIYGIYLNNSWLNHVYNNYLNNTDNAYDTGSLSGPNYWNTTKTSGTNIVDGSFLGGNFWAYPNGTGFSETCTDADSDRICDSYYNMTSETVDYLPLAAGKIQNVDTGERFFTIQVAIDDANNGDTILVRAGTYNENVDINKSINLIGAGADMTTVNASNSSVHVFNVTANSVNISGFTVTGATAYGTVAGIYVNLANNTNISNNAVIDNRYGIFLQISKDNRVGNNTVADNTYGIYLKSSGNNSIQNNNASSNGAGISLDDSSNGNTIIRNTALNNGAGIELSDSGDNTISNNTVYLNSWAGIYLVSSNSNTLTDNIADFNRRGVFLSSSSNNTLINNVARLNPEPGIFIASSSNNMIANNNVSKNGEGIWLSLSSNNVLVNNTANSNDYGTHDHGIHLSYSSNNTLINNTADSNNNYGIFIYFSSNNTFTGNTANSNNDRGITISSSDNNAIYHNNFINNTNKSFDDGNNTWHNGYPSGGNYWGDYDESSEGCNDANTDGFCDSPYNISGGGNQDMYPFVSQDGWDNIRDTQNGTNVSVVFPGCGMNMTFGRIMGAGKTTCVKPHRSSGITPPSGYKSAGIFYNLTTTANFTGNLEVCVTDFDILSTYRLFHWAGTGWEDITTRIDAGSDTLCGSVDSLSPFEVMEPSSDSGSSGSSGGGGGGGSNSKPKLVLLANSIDYNLSANFTALLKSHRIDIIYTTPENFSTYNTSKFIVIMGGPDAPDGIGEIVREVLSESGQSHLRTNGNRQMYVKTNVWARGQVVMIIAGSDRGQTRQAGEENKLAVKTKVKGH